MMCDEEVLDHFTIDNSFLYLTYFAKAYTAAAFNKLRKATGYRPHYFTVPGPDQQPLPVNNGIVYELKMMAGTIIWGITFWDGTSLPEAFNLSEKTGRKLFSEPIDARIFFGNANGLTPTKQASTGIWYLDEPFVVGEPGLMQAELYNGQSFSVGFQSQMVIFTAQPNWARQEPG